MKTLERTAKLMYWISSFAMNKYLDPEVVKGGTSKEQMKKHLLRNRSKAKLFLN